MTRIKPTNVDIKEHCLLEDIKDFLEYYGFDCGKATKKYFIKETEMIIEIEGITLEYSPIFKLTPNRENDFI